MYRLYVADRIEYASVFLEDEEQALNLPIHVGIVFPPSWFEYRILQRGFAQKLEKVLKKGRRLRDKLNNV